MKKATTLDEQLDLFRQRGVTIEDENKAKECLSDIGYYRLCSYLFPFEKTYPKLSNRTHEVVEGTKLMDAVTLYYFDFDLRNILNRYISRIEVALRTYITYTLSNKYKDSPTWFVDPAVMTSEFIRNFDDVYALIKKKPVIKRHHQKYINDKYAPAWKTIEFMTLGNIESLYLNLKSPTDKLDICRHFGVNQTAIFENYIKAIRTIRNTCAHGGVLFDIRLPLSLKNGPAGRFPRECSSNLNSSLKVIEFFVGNVSLNRLNQMRRDITEALSFVYRYDKKLEIIIKKRPGYRRYQKLYYLCTRWCPYRLCRYTKHLKTS